MAKKSAALGGLQNQILDPGGGTMERAYAAPRADGTPNPTMNAMNPQWAHWFDEAGGHPVFTNQGGAKDLPDARGNFTAYTSDLGELRGTNTTQDQFAQQIDSARRQKGVQNNFALQGLKQGML